MKTKLIQTKDYLLLIDEEAEIKGNGWRVDLKRNSLGIIDDDLYYNKAENKNNFALVKAYYPLSKEAKELDLPLLPNPFNKQIDEVTHLKNLGHECFIQMEKLNPSGGMKEFIRMAVEFGYKAAQSKQFSLEDIKKAFIAGLKFISVDPNRYEEDANNYIQSLTTQQLPKEFVGWLSKKKCLYDFTSRCTIDRCDCEFVFETITNSKGKQELVGTYKY